MPEGRSWQPEPVAFKSALVVVAHPDDESFGLGAVLSVLAREGTEVRTVCFTHGEASTLGASVDLARVRARELAAAASVLGLAGCTILDYADGGLDQVELPELSARVGTEVGATQADLLVVFDEGGVTGHPDHRRATSAALAAADDLDLPVLAWAVPQSVATALNARFGTSFVTPYPQGIRVEVLAVRGATGELDLSDP